MATYIPQKAEDSASASGDMAVPMLAVRNDAGAQKVDTDGDYVVPAADSAGRLITVNAPGAGTNRTASGTLGALNAEIQMACDGLASIAVEIPSGLTGIIAFEATMDDSTWFSVNAMILSGSFSGAHILSSTSNIPFRAQFQSVSWSKVRVRVSSYTSGSVTGYLEGNIATSTVAVAGVFPGNSPNSLGKNEDAAHATSDIGVQVLGVRNDADASRADTDGDYVAPSTDATGRLKVVTAPATPSATAYNPVRPTDGTTFTTPGTVFDQDTGAGTQNVVGVTLRSPASGGSVPLAKAEDAAHTSGDEGIMALGVRRDTADAAALAGLNGDYIPLATDRKGNQWVRPNNSEEEWYFYNSGPITLAAIAADTALFDMFNADASKVVRLRHLEVLLCFETTVTGVAIILTLRRTTSAGTGGTAQTAWLADLNDTALDADITARIQPTGGAALSTVLRRWEMHTEEAVSATTVPDPMFFSGTQQNNLIPQGLQQKGIVLRQDQGIALVNNFTAASEAGRIVVLAGFTVEG